VATKSLRSAQRQVLLMIESSRESGREFIAGVAEYAQRFGPWRFHWQPVGLKGLARRLGDFQCDGVILRDVADWREGIPAIVLGHTKRRVAGAVFVGVDDEAVSRVVTTHLRQHGFRHFAFCGYEAVPWSEGREASYCRLLRQEGFRVACCRVLLTAGTSYRDGRRRARLKRWLQTLPRPVALMAANDDLGEQVIELCKEAGIRVPDDCAVIGVDNDPVVCGLSDPPLSSVKIQFRQAGYKAAATLDRLMSGRRPGAWSITAAAGEVVERQSTNIIAVDDPAVAKALRFIHAHAPRPVAVAEIARASGVSRRILEQRFRQTLDRSVLQQHREARAAHIARLLTETDLSLAQIAEQCAFSELSHLTRFFRAVRGQTPSACRSRVANS
jgi:LacI family transcriptional regulator